MIDLHIHSTASDGSLSPSEIFDLARESGLKAISITDHDTIDGVLEIYRNPPCACLEFITGVEISCEPPPEFSSLGSIHLLGYGFSVYDRGLKAMLNAARNARRQRNPRIIECLNRLGIRISMDQIRQRFGAVQAGRPHIAELLRELGYVETFDQAFDLYLGRGRPAYVEKFKVPCQKAVQVLLQAGGIPVLAHPGLIPFTASDQMEAFIDTLVGYGLGGMEVYYTDHDEALTVFYENLAASKKLVATGGSDFHGSFNQGVCLGTGKNNLHVRFSLFKSLIEWLETRKGSVGINLSILETNLGYGFNNRGLLETALCHRSYVNENQASCESDNERLEFLGDAVLGLCIARLLMEKSPLKKEGELSKLRSKLVSEPALAEMARFIDLGRFVRLGKGEALSRGCDKNSILSDAFEALMAAVFLDSGFDRVFSLIGDLFDESLEELLSSGKTVDYKSALQELVQEKGGLPPQYVVVDETGPDHDKTFEISLCIFGVEARGFGKTKKAAEQDAARKTLKQLRTISLESGS